ncbi:MAG: hypothetical protein QOG63_3075 [Thermoleophilaceae bacterium]|jgi:uncharacterized protein (DUF58 family)|nr:hypothetical protein [Thermoleophilaceae bacterium]
MTPARGKTVLRPPAARQGPGSMPQSLVQKLDLVIARRAGGALPGDRPGAGVGTGTELAQLRPYEVGDDVRQIDASATARSGEAYVRLHVPERTLTTWLVVDISPSMAFGTADRLKADVAEGTSLVIARLAVRRAGRVALMTFGAGVPVLHPPRAAKPGVVAVQRGLSEGVAPDGRGDPLALADALRRLGKVSSSQAGLVVVVSDFRDQDDWTRPLGALRARHSVMAVEVRDPRETMLPAVGRLAVVDPETGRHIQVDTSRRAIRERFFAIEAEGRARVARELRRLRTDHVVLSTAGDWLRQLGRRLT